MGGGGCYDGLVEDLGGFVMLGIGFAFGVDCIFIVCDDEGVFGVLVVVVDVFVVDIMGGREVLFVIEELRVVGLWVDWVFENRSMKSQMKVVDCFGAVVVVLVGSDELVVGMVML